MVNSKFSWAMCLALILSLAGAVSATITIDMVAVGDAGNAGDSANSKGWGAVSYDYQIGKYMITAGQWAAFLNAVATTGDPYKLYIPTQGNYYGQGIMQTLNTDGTYSYAAGVYDPIKGITWTENNPVNYLTHLMLARFCNWLTNGQPVGPEGAGTTEDGAYNLNGATAINTNLTRASATGYFVPTDSEWHKAAFYDAATGDYFTYANGSNTAPSNDYSDLAGANYKTTTVTVDPNGTFTTQVGHFSQNMSPYGAFDMNGNLWEISGGEGTSGGAGWISFRGGTATPDTSGTAQLRDTHVSQYTSIDTVYGWGYASVGGRVVAIVPEPSSLALLALGGLALIRRRGL